MKKRGIFILPVLIGFLVLFSCSSQKKGEQSYAGKVYHNTTAHYNGYYYAKQKMTEVENQMKNARKDDYTKLLPIYAFGNPEDQALGGDMDSVVKQLTVVVKLHPESKWADDCYFNIGKAYYYKKDYESARATFLYVSSEFKDNVGTTKKKKSNKKMTRAERAKQQEKEEAKSMQSSFLKHKPVKNVNLLWLIRTYANLKKFSDAEAILAYIDEQNKTPKDLKDDLALTKAYVAIAQKKYDGAIEPMKSAVNLTSNKKDETRYTYILAQLYQLTGNYKYANQMFTQVTKMRPSYEMDFNARISVGKNYIQAGSGSPKEIIEALENMARDEKFEEFSDQIYYYIALINLRQNKDEEAVRNLETSIRKSTVNVHQKGLSFLRIGELNFSDKDYLTAQSNYDSAVAFLDAKFDTLDRVKELKRVLDKVALQTHIIITEDSLQKLAKMTEKERNKVIADALADIERQKKYEEQDTLLNFETMQQQELPGQQATGSWYFYNTSMKATGYSDFIKKWGNRTNEDNWRRSNKKSDLGTEAFDSGSESDSSEVSTTAEGSAENQTRNAMLASIPLTPEKMKISQQKVFDAYYSLGTIFKDDLKDYPKSVETFEKLASRFPDDENIARVYYNLYLLYTSSGNSSKADTYKQLILDNYPTSAFALVIRDPDYLERAKEKESALDHYYASTYDYFVEEKYSDVIQRVRQADSIFKPNPLEPKFDLLQAFVIGKTMNREAYISALDSIVKKYPSGEVHDKAAEILTALGVQVAGPQKALENTSNEEKTNKAATYQFRPNNPQFVVVAFNTVSPKTKAISDSLANLNAANHSLENLKVNSQLLDTKTQMIVVKQFKTMDAAMNYYNEISSSETLFEQVEDLGYDIFVIDDKSFPVFYQRKNIAEYLDFFYRNYEGDGE